jgi:ureidoglycolate lyase
MTSTVRLLQVQPLSDEAFKTFGDVIQANDAAKHFSINQGYAERYDRLALVDANDLGGQAGISIFRAKARPLPMELSLLEKHPLGSQAFMPMSGHAYLVVVAPGGEKPDTDKAQCFLASATQGVNYAKGTWHHPLLALHDGDFLVVDRSGAKGDMNCVEFSLQGLGLLVSA